MKNFLTLAFIFYFAILGFAENINPNVAGIDLELSINSSNLNPDIYSTTTTNINVTNTGTESANFITVNVMVPSGFVLTGSNEYDATAGNYSGISGNWIIENLPSGISETLTLNIFTLTDDGVSLYGEVMVADGEDFDSTPGNGTANIPVEDDEAMLNFNGTPPVELPDLIIANVELVPGISAMVPQGNGIGFQVELVNLGMETNPSDFPFNNGIYLSEDTIFSADDLLLQNTEVSELGFLTLGGIIPADFPLGEHFIFFATDIDNDITESVETNNSSSPFQIILN